MPLTGPQFQQFLDALLDAFRERVDLAIMLRAHLGKSLNAIANTNSLKNDLFFLLEKAEAEGWMAELLDAARQANPGNQLLLAFASQHAAEIRRKALPPGSPAEAPRLACEPRVVRIPAGLFLMGSTDEQIEQAIEDGATEWVKDEQPQHMVETGEYTISLYPVTNREYQAFIRESGRLPPNGWNGDQVPSHKANHPVVNVSWYDAWAYCKWLSQETGKDYRLPSEAEWEKAARGMDGQIYPWGDEFTKGKANTKEAGIGNTTPAGQFSPQGDSPYECADMIGNVWELTRSLFLDYPYQAGDGREDLKREGPRVLRGGAFYNYRRRARCACRVRCDPDARDRGIGFRVVVSSLSLDSGDSGTNESSGS